MLLLTKSSIIQSHPNNIRSSVMEIRLHIIVVDEHGPKHRNCRQSYRKYFKLKNLSCDLSCQASITFSKERLFRCGVSWVRINYTNIRVVNRAVNYMARRWVVWCELFCGEPRTGTIRPENREFPRRNICAMQIAFECILKDHCTRLQLPKHIGRIAGVCS